jgi:hypothetical protein
MAKSVARSLRPVRHATASALDELEPLLEQLRTLPELVEKKRGVFYRRSKAFLHFPEDPSGLHADVRLEVDFERLRVQTPEERDALLERVRGSIGSPSPGSAEPHRRGSEHKPVPRNRFGPEAARPPSGSWFAAAVWALDTHTAAEIAPGFEPALLCCWVGAGRAYSSRENGDENPSHGNSSGASPIRSPSERIRAWTPPVVRARLQS